MGARLALSAWTTDEAATRAAFATVVAEAERLDGLWSDQTPGSDIRRLNDAAGIHAVPVSDETRRVLHAAAEAFARTRGRFDITTATLASAWTFDRDGDRRVPAQKEIDARLRLVDARAVQVDHEPGYARLAARGVRIRIDGIGRGFAVDRAAALLRGRGFTDFLIESGRTAYASGRRDGRPWRIGIADPRDAGDDAFAAIDASDAAVGTAADNQQFFIADGVRHHHLLDPQTGQPARGCRSVTILAPDAATAAWMSTAVFILGPAEGMAFVERTPDVEAVILTAGNRVLASTGLRAYVKIFRPPADGP